nr:helix-turn-helix transcriptional regulator [Liquorilactobacillus satsumensis]
MIKFHLKKILEKENLSINQVSHDTGINRASLTSMSNNSISMVRLETLDTLCNYFTIELAELITFIPDDYIVQVPPLQPKNGEWIYALATRKPIIENSEKNGVMYNAT